MEKKVEPADIASRDAVNDIEYRVKRAKSACRDPFERRAQRWFIDSFIDAGFVLKRHEASDAVMRVFGITHPRSRQLHDLTMLEVRRQLIGEKRLPLITPDLLKGTKIQALMRYAHFFEHGRFFQACRTHAGLSAKSGFRNATRKYLPDSAG